jgi:hypothetical protein
MTRRIALLTARAALGVALALPAAGAHASTPTMFQSNGAPFVDVVPSYPPGSRLLGLVLNPGGVNNTSGTICSNGNGDNVCGLYFEIAVDGDLTIASESSFTPLVSGQVSKKVIGNKTLRVAIVTTGSPLSSGAAPLGNLAITSGPIGGAVTLRKLQTVDASLDLMTGSPRALAFVPEPGACLQLGAGIGALAALARRRARRGGVR